MTIARPLLAVFAAVLLSPAAFAQGAPPDKAAYEPKVKDPVIEELRKANKESDKKRDDASAAIRKRQEAETKKRKDNRKVLRSRLPADQLPGAPKTFKRAKHIEPQAQYLTGTCWAFAGTSFLEAEAQRISGKKVKVSEMHTVYWEYVERVRRYVAERGKSRVTQGSQNNAVVRMWKLHGAVPLASYKGTTRKDGRHMHTALSREVRALLKMVKETDQWDEAWVVQATRSILDRHLGAPPERFEHKGKSYTPVEFARDVLRFRADDYIDFMSTLADPFFQRAVYEAPDNWWRDASYHNVPLDVFTRTIRKAIEGGYSIGLGGDVSEPGKSADQDIAFIPSYDIPANLIDQNAREYRIVNGSTSDDHAIHLVGYKDVGPTRWYLIKDSGRSARHGKHEGYYFFREDYLRLKMLTFVVHRDAVQDLLGQMK